MNYRTEKVVEHLCDTLVAKIAGKENVVRFSQARASNQTPGIPDRRYRVHGHAFWFEAKSEKPDAKLSREQLQFLTAELECGNLAACGVLEDIQQVIYAIRREETEVGCHGFAIAVCRKLVQSWEGRGLRGEKQSPTPQRRTP